MKAWIIKGGATSLAQVSLEKLSNPAPGPKQILVKMKAASINFRDLTVVSGQYFGTPVTEDTVFGSDGAGEVIEVGDNVSEFKVGDRIAGTFFEGLTDGPANARKLKALGHSAQGVLSEYRVFDAENAVHIPSHLSYEEAACLPCAGLTAWHSLMEAGASIGPNDYVLLLGTGGVSTFGLQFAKAIGAMPIITSSSDAKLERAAALGAIGLINYASKPEWDEEVLRLTEHNGVKAVIEVGGLGTVSKSINCLGMGAHIAMVGVLAGAGGECHPRQLMMTGSSIHGVFVGSRNMFTRMNAFIEQHNIHPVIDKVFKFDDALEAIAYFQSQKHMGKVVISVE